MRWIWILLGLAAVVAVVAWFAMGLAPVQQAVIRAGALAQANTDRSELLDDAGLRVYLCGTSSPLGDPSRARACVAVIAGGKHWIVDTGAGSAANMQALGLPGSSLGGVLLTHFHC